MNNLPVVPFVEEIFKDFVMIFFVFRLKNISHVFLTKTFYANNKYFLFTNRLRYKYRFYVINLE